MDNVVLRNVKPPFYYARKLTSGGGVQLSMELNSTEYLAGIGQIVVLGRFWTENLKALKAHLRKGMLYLKVSQTTMR